MSRKFIQAGQKLGRAFAKTLEEIRPGVRLSEVENLANQYIRAEGGKPGFKMVDKYDWATCININQGVVHGVPDDKEVKSGDIVSLDMGLYYRGWHSDMAYTKEITNSKSEIRNADFLRVGEEALEKAIDQVKPGNRVGHISQAIEETIGKAGYRVIPRLTGHGVGRELHQDPMIPGVLTGKVERTSKLRLGMGLAIEVIYTKGKPGIKTAGDGWTIVTKDGKISSLFEKTVLVTKSGAKIITPYLFRGQLNV